MSSRLKIAVENRKLVNFQHAHGISVQKFNQCPRLQEKLKIISISKDKDGKWFYSALEGENR